MKFTVATNWQMDLLDELRKYPEVEDVFGKLDMDIIGGGRSSYLLPKVNREQAKHYVEEAHKRNIKFNYLLNASCLNAVEFSKEWQYKFDELLEWIIDMKVDKVTVSSPYLLRLIKSRHSNLQVVISCFATVNGVQRAKWFEEYGADAIAWDFMCIQRDFRLMKAMVKNVSCQFHLFVNDICLYQCPSRLHHANISSHGSQSEHKNKGFVTEYCFLNCFYEKIFNPVEIIKSPWVRPEDLGEYEDIGIEKIKIVDRTCTTDWIVNVVKAYTERKYNGNLIDLLNLPGSTRLQNLDMARLIKSDTASKELLDALSVLSRYKLYYLDNSALDGFLEYFKKNECRLISCEKCGYCQKIADRSIKINPDLPESIVEKIPVLKNVLRRYLDSIHTGDIFKDEQGLIKKAV
ncbi:MAG: U32 family peptidase [bacterium]